MACCLIGWASQTEAQIVQDRSDAFNMNAKLGNGIVFGSIMWTFENTNRYDVRDFELAREHDFNHVRICARMQNMQTSTGVLSDESMDQLIAIIDDALANDLIAVICPFFWWKATLANEPPAFSNGDITALADMWEQIAIRCKEEGYGLEDVVFELYEEPEIGIDVERLIGECVDKITAVENRYIIIPGRGFRTIVGMGRVLNDDHIPLDYDRLIGTFHFYEPKCEFCNLYQSACGVTTEPSAYIPWPNQTYDEAALRSWFVTLDQQNANWASRNGTVKLPMYMGEFGTLNKPSTGNIAGRFDLPREERKHWIWWTRMVAEEYGYSTAYWNAYGNNSFGLGNWDILNPAARNMADPNDPTDEELIRHSLLGRYEAEDLKSVASISGFTIGSDTQTSHDYLSFQGSAPNQGLKFDDVYVGMDGVYNVSIRFSNAHATELQLDVQSQEPDSTPLTSRTAVPFAITGDSNWYAKTIPMQLKAGINTIELSGTTGDLRIDYIGVTQVDKVFLDQGYETLATDDRAGTSSDLPVQAGLVLHLDASRLSGYAEGDLIELWSNLAVA
ncbi:MAG: cellulase family glycosylhydrolase, partial [Verrucomicrobiota bacterium]